MEERKRYVSRVKDSEEGTGEPLWGTLEEVQRKSLNVFNIEVGKGKNVLLFTRDNNDYIQCVAEYDSTCGKWGNPPLNPPSLGKDYSLLERETDDETLYKWRNEYNDYRIQVVFHEKVLYHVYMELKVADVLRLARLIKTFLQDGQTLTIYGRDGYNLFATRDNIFLEGWLRKVIAHSLDCEIDYDFKFGAYFSGDQKNESSLRRGDSNE